MNELDEVQSVRLRRNRRLMFVAIVTFGSVVFCLPRLTARRNALKEANVELRALQDSIVATQKVTRDVQAETLRLQGEIRALQQR